jgi:hypothetical protein
LTLIWKRMKKNWSLPIVKITQKNNKKAGSNETSLLSY